MISHLKALGLALAACLALGALAASGASAQGQDHFTSDSENEKTVLTGEDTHDTGIFQIHGVAGLFVTCTDATYGGTVDGNQVNQVTVVPTYNECEASTGEATVDVHTCGYILYGETTKHARHPSTGTGPEEVHAPVEVECADDGYIRITTPGCELRILADEQEKLHGVTYENIANHEETGKSAVEVNFTVDGITYTSKGFVCELGGVPHEGATGTLTGEAIVTGYEDTDEDPAADWQHEFDDGEGLEDLVNIGVEST